MQHCIDAIHDMRTEIKGIAGQIQSGNFTLRDESWREMKEDYLALAVTLVDIIDGAAYLFEKEPPIRAAFCPQEMESGFGTGTNEKNVQNHLNGCNYVKFYLRKVFFTV